MKKYLLAATAVLFSITIHAQHSIQTVLTADGLLSDAKIKTTDDGGFIVTSAYTGGIYAIMLTKFNDSAQLQWTRAYGDGLYVYYPPSLVVCRDGGYAVTGISAIGLNSSVYAAKFTAAGDLAWQKRFTYAVNGFTSMRAYDITEAVDESLLITGTSNLADEGDVFVLNLNSSTGAVNWFRTTGRHFYNETGRSIHTTPDKGFVVGGTTGSTGSPDNSYLIIKYNNRGNMEWTKTMKGRFSAGNNDLLSIVPDNNGGFVFTGDTYSEGYEYDPVLVNLNFQRNIGWAWKINKPNVNYSKVVLRIKNGNYVMMGADNSGTAYLASFASNGLFVSASEDYGELGNAYYTSATPFSHNNYLTTTVSNSKIIISRFDDNSNNCGVTNVPDIPSAFIIDTFSTTYKIRDITASLQSLDIQLNEIPVTAQLSFLCRAQHQGITSSTVTALTTTTDAFKTSLYPNPAGNQITISLTGKVNKAIIVYITDVQGRAVAEFHYNTQSPGNFTKTIDIASLHEGIYLLTATDGKIKTIIKFIKTAK